MKLMLKMRLSGFESSIALNPSSTKLNIPPNQNSAATCLRKKKNTAAHPFVSRHMPLTQ